MKEELQEDDDKASQEEMNGIQDATSNEHPEKEDTAAGGSDATPKRKRKKRKTFDVVTPDDLLPSHARKTDKGGYAHTNQSKGKISKANMGNTPWNKGRNRSSADRAKIAAGVRARNRAILLEKLKRLGMTEKEYEAKKKEIKYLRERIRRTKKANAKQKKADAERITAEDERKLQAAIDATTEKKNPGSKAAEKPKVVTAKKQKKQKEDTTELAKTVFSKDVVWTQFSFGENGRGYEEVCPIGGPGGIVCCEACADLYSSYLNQTVKDMEIQRADRNGREVQQLLDFLVEGRKALERSFVVAKKRVPPLPPPSQQPRTNSKAFSRKAQSGRKNTEPAQWNMTSTFDIGLTDGPTKV